MRTNLVWILVALLALPTVGFGLVNIAVTGDDLGDPSNLGNGTNAISVAGPLNAGDLSIKISLTLSGGDEIDGIQWSWMGSGLAYAGDAWSNGAIFSAGDYQGNADGSIGSDLATSSAGFPESYFKGTPGALPATGVMAMYEVTNLNALAVNDSIVLGVGDAGPGYFTSPTGGVPTSSSLTITVVVPEPATGLLLLGAIPFLRRRRTA